ncbi:cytochrome P450 [Phaeosphaeriaceae sp. SRC1lsM3a]|nr:cytochrome P450 [Stagonospora sp. SRC1lsM3a]
MLLYMFNIRSMYLLPITTALLLVALFFKSRNLFFRICSKRPHIHSIAVARVRRWAYLLNGPGQIDEGYRNAKGKPFEIVSPDIRHVFVSSAEDIKTIGSGSYNMVSLSAAAKQMFQVRHSMQFTEWADERGKNHLAYVTTTRTRLTRQTPLLIPEFRRIIREDLKRTIWRQGDSHGTTSISVYSLMKQIIGKMNGRVFFGPEFSSDPDFMKMAVAYADNVIFIAEAIRAMPRCFAPLIGGLGNYVFKSQKIVRQRLLELVEARIASLNDPTSERPEDVTQWLIEAAGKKSPLNPETIVQEVLGLWLGAVHSVVITTSFVLLDLCLHPEYVEPLRKATAGSERAAFDQTGKGLSLLDSFIKESTRLQPVAAISVRRRVLQSFVLSHGTTVNVGDWVGVPLRAVMRDECLFPDANEFQGFRFAPAKSIPSDLHYTPSSETGTEFTDLSTPVGYMWGAGNITCAGRWYASAVIKLILVEFLEAFDLELANSQAPRIMSWKSSFVPRSDAKILIRPRNLDGH